MQGRREQRGQRLDGGQGERLAHRRQVDERLDGPRAELRADALVLGLHRGVVRVGRPVDAHVAEEIQADRHRVVAAVEDQVDVHLQAGHPGALHGRRGAPGEHPQALLGLGHLAGGELAFGAAGLQGEQQFVAALPARLVQQLRAAGEIGQGRGIGGRGLGPLPGEQVELGQALALGRLGDQRGAAVELADDLEDRLFARLRRRLLGQQAADPQVLSGALGLGDQQVGRLVDAVVGKGVGTLPALHQFLADGVPQGPLQLAAR